MGMAVGIEALCRLSLVIPKAIHKSGFHPTSVLGAMASTLAVSAALAWISTEGNSPKNFLHRASNLSGASCEHSEG
jgi:hypothetical protein